MKICCLQMDMEYANPDNNFVKARELIKENRKDNDVLILPETWNVGFFPKENLAGLADNNGERIKKEIGGLAKELDINIVAGSIANNKDGGIYNTSYTFDREGKVVAEYDKTHLFTPMDEHKYFEVGNKNVTFTLDGIKCGIIICYDTRFPEWIRNMTIKGLDLLFIVSQWPNFRADQLVALARARAIENQMFVAFCNSCGTANDTKFGGNSSIIDPMGKILAKAEWEEEVISAEIDTSVLEGIRTSINVFRDRRPELYKVN